ncbi:FtsK/SpoIIIE domain-containing protein [uncultured Pseudokineococcus sp.]|uniref:FtsK/SpoIIIE domain-containing protein n=1 Tax=uncultured Pseudokineococcus sp. TaxID=1642928 RepID=UPI0026198700|nr:FtsK/SpoIIIE domain-containing protein [uncultured Pseudokineococcus sp.]
MDARAAALHDVEVSAEPGSTVASLLDALPLDVAGRRAYVGFEVLDPAQTIAESPLSVGCLVSMDVAVPGPRSVPDGAGGALRVLSGPDTGRWTWLLTDVALTVGREPGAGLVLTDPKVSGRHAEVVVGRDEARVTDCGSTNGTRIAGVALQEQMSLPDGGTVEVGESVLQWLRLERVEREWRRSPDGRLEFTRRFHRAEAPVAASVDMPAPVPTSTRNFLAMGAALVAPLVLGGVMALANGQPAYLLMALLAPVTAGLGWVVERRTRRQQQVGFEKEKIRAATEISAAVTDQERVRRLNDPDEVTLGLYALGALPGLWTKELNGPDALTMRVGVRDEDAQVELRGERWPGLEPPRLRSVPVTLDLRATGVVGVVGDTPRVEGLARWLVLQLATRRSPEDLSLHVLSTGDGSHLHWVRWLPHVDAGPDGDVPCLVAMTDEQRMARAEELERLVRSRQRARQGTSQHARADSDVVVVLDGAHELRRLSGMRTVLTEGPEVGVYAICLDETDVHECRGTIAVDAQGRLDVVRTHDAPAVRATAESTTRDDAERIARLLAPMRDRAHGSGGDTAIPHPVRFLDLVKIGSPEPTDVARVWEDHPGPTLRVPLGADASGTVHVDLVGQGPHTMLAGTTGAGKSVLLQALIASLLLHNRPDELNLILVDFKGGAAFLPFERCPHVVGLIRSAQDDPATRFDEAAAARVLASLREEKDRRTRIVAQYEDIDTYLRKRPAGAPALPRLVMVFDEFARVLDAAPGFLPELVAIAGVGRSLGMHLLFATQALSGKLTPEMKTNINLRISLRQNEPGESIEVLDVPDAVHIPGRLRGRGLILSRVDELPQPRPFQSGYLGAPPPVEGAPPAQVRIVDWPAVGDLRPVAKDERSNQPTDQDLLIAAVERAAKNLNLPAPLRPLLPPLPPTVTLAQLTELATSPAPAATVPFGLADHPEQQAQPQEHVPLTGDTRVLIAGGPQSGRTTAVRTLIHAAAERLPPDQLHLYVVEREPAGLSTYAELPHCGGVFGADEPDRVRRFVTWLYEEVERRKRGLTAARGETPPTLLVLIDGWELFHDPADPGSVGTSVAGRLVQVIEGGTKVGVRVVVTSERGPLTRKPGDLFATKVVLKFPQANVVRDVLPASAFLPPPLPGRGVVVAEGGSVRHVQVAQPGESVQALVERVRGSSPTPERAPRRFPSLPWPLPLADVPRPDGVSDGWVPLGVGGPDLGPVGVDLFTGPQGLLVSGPAKSGRSTAAATTALALAQRGVGCIVLCKPQSPVKGWLSGRANVMVLEGPTLTDEVIRSAAAGLGTDRVVVIADDCEQLTMVATEKSYDELPTLLAEALTPERSGQMGLVLCGNGMPLLESTKRSLASVAQRVSQEGATLLLTPTDRATAREHRLALEADQYLAGPAGRGYLLSERRQQLVQLPNRTP